MPTEPHYHVWTRAGRIFTMRPREFESRHTANEGGPPPSTERGRSPSPRLLGVPDLEALAPASAPARGHRPGDRRCPRCAGSPRSAKPSTPRPRPSASVRLDPARAQRDP